jgi:lysozyme
MIDQLIEDLKRDEGFKDHPYQDHLGFWTIGYGSLIDARRGSTIPSAVATMWLELGAQHRWHDLLDLFPWLADQPEEVQRALANMAYQLGVNGVAKFRRMMEALESGDRKLAAVEALDSRWAQQTPARAKRVADLIRGDT